MKEEKQTDNMSYEVGLIYDSEEAGDVIYVGWSDKRQRHMFKLYHTNRDTLLYEGGPQEDGQDDFLGEITDLIIQ